MKYSLFPLSYSEIPNFEDAKELAIKWAKEIEWDEDDEEVTVELKGPDGEDSFVVTLKEVGE